MAKYKNNKKESKKILKDALENLTKEEIKEILKNKIPNLEFKKLAVSITKDEIDLPSYIKMEEVKRFLEK